MDPNRYAMEIGKKRGLQKHLTKYPPLTVRNALRVGTVELCTGSAAHGVVNAMVELVSQHKRYSHMKGLTNAFTAPALARYEHDLTSKVLSGEVETFCGN